MKLILRLKQGLFAALAALGFSSFALPAQADDQVLSSPAHIARVFKGGPLHVELKLNRDGQVYKAEFERGREDKEKLEDRVVSLDKASNTLTLAHLGKVSVAQAYDFEHDDRDLDRSGWLGAVEAALSAGQSVWVEAKGELKAGTFHARKIESELSGESELKVNVKAADYDANSNTLRVGGLSFSLNAARVTLDD